MLIFAFFLFKIKFVCQDPPTALRSESVKLPFPFAEYERRARQLCGQIAEVRKRTFDAGEGFD